MRKIENLGVIKTKHNSGIAQTDKGAKFPNINCEIGDVMLDIDMKRVIVTPEVYKAEYKADVTKWEKAKAEAADKKEKEDFAKKEENAQKDADIAFENKRLKAQNEAAQAEIKALKKQREEAEAIEAKRVLQEIEDVKDGKDA